MMEHPVEAFNIEQRAREVEVHLTYRCNLSCPSCDHAGWNKKANMPPDITEETFVRILDDMERLNWRKRIHIIGGEPTLHKDCARFTRLAFERDFEVIFLSNQYTQASRDIVKYVDQEGLITRMMGGSKQDGPKDHCYNPYIFCDPMDLGVVRQRPCQYTTCGISADQNGCTPCPIGGVLAHYRGLTDILVPLEQLLDSSYVDRAMTTLCEHCGGYLQLETEIRNLDQSKIHKVGVALMTDFWRRIFECST